MYLEYVIKLLSKIISAIRNPGSEFQIFFFRILEFYTEVCVGDTAAVSKIRNRASSRIQHTTTGYVPRHVYETRIPITCSGVYDIYIYTYVYILRVRTLRVRRTYMCYCFQERVRVEAAKVGAAVAGRLEERARREESSRREVRDLSFLSYHTYDVIRCRMLGIDFVFVRSAGGADLLSYHKASLRGGKWSGGSCFHAIYCTVNMLYVFVRSIRYQY